MTNLQQQIDSLSLPLRARLDQRGFSAARLSRWAASIAQDAATHNRLPGKVTMLDAAALGQFPTEEAAPAAACRERGEQALRAGELAVCVLAGGMATRMGGLVKALVGALDEASFLDMRLAERASLAQRYGAAPPLWLMTSEPTHAPVQQALERYGAGAQVACFEQFVSLRLDQQGNLFRTPKGEASVYATGHGDLPDALIASGLLSRFVEGGGRQLWISNVDNLGACVDAELLGQHILSQAALTVELVDKLEGDRGGGPVLHDGRPIIAENFRLPSDFDGDAVPVFNTNTFIVDARALLALQLEWTYVRVNKQVGEGQAVQFERLLGELTEGLDCQFVRVPRSRFLPIKTRADLQTKRPAIQRLARERGWDQHFK